MLAADKSTLEAELAQQLAALQSKELAALQRNFHNLATTCAVLIGFGFGGLGLFLDDELLNNWVVLRCLGLQMGFDYSGDPEPSHSECVRATSEAVVDAYWALCCALSLSFNFLALFISTITSITGPALALRGPEGSLGVALVHMEQQMKRALRYFGRALAAFSFTIIGFGAQAVAALGFLKGVIILGVGGWTIYAIVYYGIDIGTKFHLAIGRAVRAEFQVSAGDASPQPGGGGHSMSGLPTEEGARGDAAAQQEAQQADFARARLEHQQRVAPSTWCSRLLLWRNGRGRIKSVSGQRARPLWRLDNIAVLPYHQLQAARDRHGRAKPREQVISLIERMQGAGLRGDASTMGAPSSAARAAPGRGWSELDESADAALGAAEWLERVAQAAVFPFRTDDQQEGEGSAVGDGDCGGWSSWWPFGPAGTTATRRGAAGAGSSFAAGAAAPPPAQPDVRGGGTVARSGGRDIDRHVHVGADGVEVV
jgi:hypothetical protein